MHQLTDLVLFSGAGGASRGLEAAGWNVGLAVDGWDKACQAHRRWMPSTPVVQARIKDAHRLVRGPVRYVWASPSCKPWSTANRTPKRGLVHPEYYSLAELVRQVFDELQARWLVIENVGGLVWSREGVEEVARLRAAVAARGLRMSLPRGGTIASNTLGVAQLRRRVFIVIGPELVAIRPGGGWIPPAGTGPLLWEAEEAGLTVGRDHGRGGRTFDTKQRDHRGAVDASSPARHQNWTLATYCELQHIPPWVVEGFTKREAHEMVGNCVPPPVAEHIGRLILKADAREAA